MARYRPRGTATWLLSPLRDLSQGGARFLCDQSFEVGTALEMEIILPMIKQPIWCPAEVAWVKPADQPGCVELGVAFQAGDDRTREALQQAVRHFMKRTTQAENA